MADVFVFYSRRDAEFVVRLACTGTPQRGAVVAKAIELVRLGRISGYDRAELVDIIEALP